MAPRGVCRKKKLSFTQIPVLYLTARKESENWICPRNPSWEQNECYISSSRISEIVVAAPDGREEETHERQQTRTADSLPESDSNSRFVKQARRWKQSFSE